MVIQKMNDLVIVFYIFDDLNRFTGSFVLNSNSNVETNNSKCSEVIQLNSRKHFTAVLKVDGYFLSVFNRVMKTSEIYSKMVFNNFLNKVNFVPADNEISVKVMLVKPKLEILDYAWNDRLSHLLIERQELQHAMSWLSTLGGAFSALGDNFENCAKVAGKISVQQFKIAFRLGEPPLVARCRLYMALSLIQLGKLSTAKEVIEKQYQVAKIFKDIRLQNMCRGVWAKLQYSYKQRKVYFKNCVF